MLCERFLPVRKTRAKFFSRYARKQAPVSQPLIPTRRRLPQVGQSDGDSWSPVIDEVLVCGLLNEFFAVLNFAWTRENKSTAKIVQRMNFVFGAWTRENSEIKSTAKNIQCMKHIIARNV